MTVNSAVTYIQDEMKYEAKRYFYDKYNALDENISADGFTYTKDTKSYVHPFKAITSDYIRKSLNDEMHNVAMSLIPIKLLERTGGTPSVLRQVNKYWYVRVPSYPTVGETLDIDDGLCQVVIYKALSSIGITKFIQVSKDIMESYSKTVVIPDPFDTNANIEFRFSSDGNVWHDTYQSGDIFWSVARDGVWGNGVPIGGGSSQGDGVGATKFIELTDVQTPLVAGKMLVVNSEGDGIVMQDVPTSGTGGGVEHEGVLNFTVSTASPVIDLSGDTRIAVIDVESNVEIDFTKTFVDYNVVDGAEYKLLIYPNSNTVTFNSNITMNGISPINSSALCVMITIVSMQYQFFVIGQKEF